MKEFSYATHIMGCAFEVDIITSSKALADALYVKALRYAQSYEETFSRFLPESELSSSMSWESVPLPHAFCAFSHSQKHSLRKQKNTL